MRREPVSRVWPWGRPNATALCASTAPGAGGSRIPAVGVPGAGDRRQAKDLGTGSPVAGQGPVPLGSAGPVASGNRGPTASSIKRMISSQRSPSVIPDLQFPESLGGAVPQKPAPCGHRVPRAFGRRVFGRKSHDLVVPGVVPCLAVPNKRSSSAGLSVAQKIDARIDEFDDWRGKTLARVRALVKQADPEVTEEWKWEKPSSGGIPVWYHDGGICTGEVYKDHVKLTFFKGASLDDPSGLFNSSLEGKIRRAIDLHEGDKIDAKAFKALIRAAVEMNRS